MISRSKWLITFGVLSLLVSLYSLGGAVQAAMLFVGLRALRNFNLWASLALVAFVASVACFLKAGRARSESSSPWSALASILLLALGALALRSVLVEFAASDWCLDSGGSFDYIRSVCDFERSHPYVALADRSGFSLVASVVLLGLGGVMALSWLRSVWHNRGAL